MTIVVLRATVSGSFHQGMADVQRAVELLTDLGVSVLSPADPRIVDRFGEFLFVASDRLRSIRLVQQRHLAAIAASDLLWLVAPAGYVGTSAAMEIGYAAAMQTPVYGDTPPNDLTLRQYVRVTKDVRAAIAAIRPREAPSPLPDVLLDPTAAVEAAHACLDVIHRRLFVAASGNETTTVAAAQDVRSILQRL